MNPTNDKDRQIFQMQKQGFESIAENGSDIKKVLTPISKLAEILIGEAKGEDGYTPTNEDLLKIIKPLIPEIRQPKDGNTPTNEELLVLIRQLMPDVKDGETPSDERLVALIRPLIPTPEKVIIENEKIANEASNKAVEAVKKLIPKIDPIEVTAKKLDGIKEPWLSIEAIRGDFNTKVTKQFGGGNTRPLDILINGVSYGGVREINIEGTGVAGEIVNGVMTITIAGGGGTMVDNEVVSGSGTSWTLSQTPVTGTVHLFALGQRLVLTTDYSISGASITTVSSWSGGDLIADYQV